jgi:hypothetical protein
MCESFERLNQQRLEQLQRQEGRTSKHQGDAQSFDSEAEGEGRRNIKRSFQAKLFSPLLGYGTDFCLLQYVYDLHLWTDLGSKRNQAGSTAMRIMMSGHPMSPLFWQDIMYGLFDLARQLGFPDVY